MLSTHDKHKPWFKSGLQRYSTKHTMQRLSWTQAEGAYMRRHISNSLGLSLVDLGCESAAIPVLHKVTGLLSRRQQLFGQELVLFGQVLNKATPGLLAVVHELYAIGYHDSHLSNCHLMPDLELESVVAVGIVIHRSAHLCQSPVDQHTSRLTWVQKNVALLTWMRTSGVK